MMPTRRSLSMIDPLFSLEKAGRIGNPRGPNPTITSPRPIRRLLGVFVGIFLTLIISGLAAGQTVDDREALEKLKAAEPIPMAEVAVQAAEVFNLINDLRAKYAERPVIDKLKAEIADTRFRIRAELIRTRDLLKLEPTIERLKTERQIWEKRQAAMMGWLNRLTLIATQLDAALDRMNDLENKWRGTLEEPEEAQVPESVSQRIHSVLSALDAEILRLRQEQTEAIELQSLISEEVARCETLLAEISRSQQAAVGGIAKRKRLPIWQIELWIDAWQKGPDRLRRIGAELWEDFRRYRYEPDQGLPIHLGFFLVLVVFFQLVRKKYDQWPADKQSASIGTVTDRPFSAAFIGALMLATSPYAATPPTVRNLLSVLALAAMIRFMKPTIDRRLAAGLKGLLVLFVLDTVRHAFAGAILLDLVLVMIEALSGILMLLWSLTRGRFDPSFAHENELEKLGTLRKGALLVLILLFGGLSAAILGHLRIAEYLVSGLLIGGAWALTLFASVRIVIAMAAYSLRVRPLQLLRMVRNHTGTIERRLYRILIWAAVVGWSIRVLDYLGIFQPATNLGEALLSIKLERGAIRVSFGDIVTFGLTLWASYLLSKFIRFALEEDVYPRKELPRGVAYAASQLIHYILLSLGFLVGLGMLGIDLTRVTVLLGAFGVGIGFGLQNVVNNFVSGLILLFERPIHIGDTIELQSVVGQVRRIGLRSSVVRTRQGAEIIVPNSYLVSDQVTNWTFSDQTRRIELPVGVNYSAPPQKVIEVIESAASGHPRILNDPPPQALFLGFGNSSIDFELRAWTSSFLDWNKVRSDLAVAVYDAVRAAGFSFPFPQREVRLLQEEEALQIPG
jgi:small-conductance mechanosensitive channel